MWPEQEERGAWGFCGNPGMDGTVVGQGKEGPNGHSVDQGSSLTPPGLG